ncbi:MAG: ATP-binding cassette domain-containing protein [Oscillospiraceae bacterium]|nr:ATP-binding cassette domain-containing protein [Oscillospiraceae bacterium]
MIVIKDLSKSYGKNKALNNISLDLVNGVYALLGPNGAGKSTLMNILTLSLRADEGKVLWKGASQTDAVSRIEEAGKDYRAVLGYMPQQQGMYDGFRGVDFLSYIAGLKDIPPKRTKEEVERVATLVNLSDRLRDRISGYSGGMKQRILFASAIIGDPQIIVLDEPTAGLDPKERIRIREIVKSMAGEKIILFATHVVSDIETIADDVILLRKGVVIERGSPSDLCERFEITQGGLESVYMKVFEE